MINEDSTDPLKQLQLIDSMINKAKNRFSENGHSYLVWGWTILFCSIGHYLLQNIFKVPYHWMIWILTWVVLIYQVFYLRRKKRKAIVRTYTDELIKYVWLVFVILLFLCMIIVSRVAGSPDSINAVILVLYGMPTFLSGIILKFRSLIIGGCCCWLLAITTIFLPMEMHVLLLAAAVIIAWIIPGYMLRVQYKKQHSMAESL